MGDHAVTSYGEFDNAVSTTKTVSTAVDTETQTLTSCKTDLSNQSIFMGPICDSCLSAFGNVESKLSSLSSDYSKISTFLIESATGYKTADSNAAREILGSSTVKDGNVIDTSKSVGTGTKYNFSDEDLAYLAYVAKREQGTVGGSKLELSLMANLYEKNKNNYSSVKDYVDNSGWFASGSRSGYTYPGDEYVEAAREVLNNGNRYLASNVVEHDCISDIEGISTGSKDDRSNYIPNETIIDNRYGSKYVFVGFAPDGGDPFGYLV